MDPSVIDTIYKEKVLELDLEIDGRPLLLLEVHLAGNEEIEDVHDEAVDDLLLVLTGIQHDGTFYSDQLLAEHPSFELAPTVLYPGHGT